MYGQHAVAIYGKSVRPTLEGEVVGFQREFGSFRVQERI